MDSFHKQSLEVNSRIGIYSHEKDDPNLKINIRAGQWEKAQIRRIK